MREIHRLIQDIRALLGGGHAGLSLEALAASYAHWRTEAARRLEACAAMLEKGGDYQALQLAEAEPPLMDLVAELSFAEEPQWVERCADQGLGVVPRLDVKAVQALDALYAKGISPNSPLYKDYRAAATGRDDGNALRIMRTIVRLNPDDQNARAEVIRLENKMLLAKLAALEAALAKDDQEGAAALVDELETLAPEDKLKDRGEFVHGLEVRAAVKRRRAEAETPGLFTALSRQRSEDDWKGASETASRLRAIEREHSLGFPPDRARELTEAERYVDGQRQAAADETRFQKALAQLVACAEELDTRLLTGATLTLDEAQRREEEFARAWKEAERLGRPVPADRLARIQAAGAGIRREAQRRRRSRRVARTLAAAVVTVLLVAGGGLGIVAWRAHDHTEQLNDLRSRRQVTATGKLLEEISHARLPGLLSWPSLQAKMAELRAWEQQEQRLLMSAGEQLHQLEVGLVDDFKSSEPEALRKGLEGARQAVEGIAPDLAPESRDRLAVIENRIDQHFNGLAMQSADQARKEVAHLADIAKDLSFEKERQELAATLAAITPRLEVLERLAQDDSPDVKMSAEVGESIRMLRTKITPYQEEVTAIETARASAAEARNEEAYHAALTSFTKLRLVEAGDVNGILANFPTVDDMLARLFFQGDNAAWEAVKADVNGAKLRPNDVAPEEIKTLLALRDDPMLNEIWENKVTKHPQGRENLTWSKGEPKATVIGFQKTWRGSFYQPDEKDRPFVSFFDTDFSYQNPDNGQKSGYELNYSRLSSTVDMMNKLQLSRMADADGNRYEKTLLETFDVIVAQTKAHPLAKAYVMMKLGRMMKMRPYAWGAHYARSLNADLARLDKIFADLPLRSEDWMSPAANAKAGVAAREFYQKAAGRTYLNEAFALRKLVMAVRDAKMHFAGHLDDRRKPHVLASARSATEVWAVSEEGSSPLPLRVQDGVVQDEAARCRKWSPLFFIPLDRNALLAEMQRGRTDAPAPEAGASPDSGKVLFLQTP